MSTLPVPRRRPIVAIDGPAGAGKSTVAAFLAEQFGLLNLESGAMYRAFAFKAIEASVPCDDEAALMRLAAKTQIALEAQGEGNRVLLDGSDVTAALRTPQVTAAASLVSVHPAVRRWLVEQQRTLGKDGGVVMEGRDIGTVVFPEAEVKIFLDADPEVRGDRRFRQTVRSPQTPEAPSTPAGQVSATQVAILEAMRTRDARDRTRADSPLRPAPDAHVIDSTFLTLAEVLAAAGTCVAAAMKPE